MRTRISTGLALVVLFASPPTPTGVQPEQAPDPVSLIVTGTGDGPAAQVKAFDAASNTEVESFLPYGGFNGGVRVALGDVNGDGAADILTGAGPGAPPEIKVISGANGAVIRSFLAFDPASTGGVFVAAGDVNGDGRADIVTGAGSDDAPQVRVFDGGSGAQLVSFFAYGEDFIGGVRVAAGDVNGDGKADIVTGPGPGIGPNVKVFDVATGAVLASLTTYASGFRGGVFVAAGDLDGDGKAEVVTGAGQGGFPQVKVFRGSPLVQVKSLFVYELEVTGGVAVAAGDVNGDGKADIVTGAGPGAGPHVKAFNGVDYLELGSFFAYPSDLSGGVWVAAGPAGSAVAAPPTIEGLIATAQAALADGSLTGSGPGSSARGRAGAWMNMLTEAQARITASDVAAACDQLTQAHQRADGVGQEFVAGSGRAAIDEMIVALMEEVGCGA